MPVEVDTKYKFILTLNNPSFENPYGEALLSRAYWAWYFRFNGWNFFAKFLERAGIPLLVGKSTDTQRMGAALSRAHANSVIAVDRDDSVDLLSNGGANQGNAFDVFEAAVVRRIEKLILGQTLTSGTDGGSGNRALGDVHNDVRGDKKFADIEREKVGIQTLVKALCELNEYPILSVAYSGAVDLDADRAARDAILTEKLGVEFSDTYISSKYSLESDDFTRRTAVTAPLPQVVQNEQ
jgi:phage gp29-like protein